MQSFARVSICILQIGGFMDLPQADGADPATVFTAALAALFSTHPDPAALLKAWEPVATSIPLMMLKNGATDVHANANVVIAQALLHIARVNAGAPPPVD
jgi:hypothetical protein